MPANAIACAACSFPVPAELWNREEEVRCPQCGQNLRALVFPAIDNTGLGTLPSALQGEAESSCFYHPQSRAALICDDCGRFLCNLCDLDVDGRHICPRCFETAGPVVTRRTMHDTLALCLATFPWLFWPSLVISAPWTLFMVFRRWKTPGSLVPRTKIRFVLAGLFAIAEIGFGVFIIYLMTQVNLKAPPR